MREVTIGQVQESELVIARFLGHAAASAMTDRYIHLSPEHFRGIVRGLDTAAPARAIQTATWLDLQVEGARAKVVSSYPAKRSENVGR